MRKRWLRWTWRSLHLGCLISCLILSSCGEMEEGVLSSKDKAGSSSVVSTATVTMASVLQEMEGAFFVEGELIVKFKKEHKSLAKALHRATGSTVIKRFSVIPEMEVIKLPKDVSVRDGIIKYMSDPSVEYAEPNYIRKLSRIPNDTYFDHQWALLNTGQFNGRPGSDIKATGAWDINTGSSNTVIAIIDTGMDYVHSDLTGNNWVNDAEDPDNGIDDDGNGKIDDRYGWDFTNCARFNPDTGRCTTPKVPDNDPKDDNGHGTHVAGIIGASGNNGIGIAGVMWNVKLMPLKILNADGEGSIADEIAALDYLVMMKQRGINIMAINASFGGGEYSSAEFDAIKKVSDAGILFVTAAGNGGTDSIGDNNDEVSSYPGNYNLPNIISVAATDQNDNLAAFSNYGPNTVHVAAPGVYVLSIVPTGINFYSGTSMAAPYVTGLAGLLYSQYPWFSPSQVRSTIMRYVDSIPSLSGKIISGGRINAYYAISSLLSPTGFAANGSSDSTFLEWTDRATGEDGYKLERKVADGSYSVIATLPSNTNSYNDTTVNDGVSYSYRVSAYNTIAESDYLEAQVVTPLKSPSNLSLSSSTNEVTLSWTDNSSSEDGFRIERKGQEGVFTVIATVGSNITTYSDKGLQEATTYTYRVKAFNSIAGESLPVEASVTTAPQSGGPGSSSGGGGGGCSLVAVGTTGDADISLLLIPLTLYIVRRFRRG